MRLIYIIFITDHAEVCSLLKCDNKLDPNDNFGNYFRWTTTECSLLVVIFDYVTSVFLTSSQHSFDNMSGGIK